MVGFFLTMEANKTEMLNFRRMVKRLYRSKKRKTVDDEIYQLERDRTAGRTGRDFWSIRKLRNGYQTWLSRINNSEGEVLVITEQVERAVPTTVKSDTSMKSCESHRDGS